MIFYINFFEFFHGRLEITSLKMEDLELGETERADA